MVAGGSLVGWLARLVLALAIARGGTAYEGYAPYYAPGLMEKVAARRGMDVAGCMVASSVAALGERVYVYGVRTGRLLYCTVVDVSETRDRPGHLRRRIYAELAWDDATNICGQHGRTRDCPIILAREP